jgi:hypothetical protein
MKLLALISVAFLLSGCDVASYFHDSKTKVSGYVCEISSKSKFVRNSGEADFREVKDNAKDKDKNFSSTFIFTLTEHYAPYFSPNREKNQFYYELRSFTDDGFKQKLTINVWPKKKDGFTSIKAIEDGYAALITKDEVTFRRNTEQVKVTDGIVSASMWDYYNNLDIILDRTSSPETREKIKILLKDKQFPFHDYVAFNMNRVSGVFKYEEVSYYGEEKKPDTREANRLIYKGFCRAGLNL